MSEYKPILTRLAHQEDITDILDITKEAFMKYAFDLGKPELVYALNDDANSVAADLETKNVYVAFLAGEPVGTIRFETIGQVGFISRFGVYLKAQSCGVGGALIRKVVQDCKEQGLSAVALHTSAKMSSLIRFYYGQGFYIRCTDTSRGYVRALLVHELEPDFNIDLSIFAP